MHSVEDHGLYPGEWGYPVSNRAVLPEIFSERQFDWMYEFNNNGTHHFVLLAAGEYNSRTGRLTDHQRNRVPSFDVVDFAKLYNVEGVGDPLTVHPWLEKGCGNEAGEKGCFGYPYDCVRYASSKLLATYKKNGNRLSMQLQVRYQYFRSIDSFITSIQYVIQIDILLHKRSLRLHHMLWDTPHELSLIHI